MKILFILFLLIHNLSFAESAKYICIEKKVNQGGFKGKLLLIKNDNFFEIDDEKNERSVEIDNKFNIQHQGKFGFFAKPSNYQDGALLYSFDTKTLTSHFIEQGRTYITDYDCSPL